MPERKPFKMPDGGIYLFPHDVTDEELLAFADQVDPWMPSQPSHAPTMDTEVDPEAPDSMIGEESGERTPPTLEPAHEKTLTQAEALKAVEIAAMTPATAPGALHAVGRGEGTDPARVLSGVSPAPGPYMGDFFRDPGPYFADVGSEIYKEGKRAVTEPLEFAEDLGTVLTAPSGGLNIAFGGEAPSMGPEDPLLARTLERGTAQAASFAPALIGTLLSQIEQGIIPGAEEKGYVQPSGWAEELQRLSAEMGERAGEIDTGARSIFDVKDPSQTSEFLANVFGEQGPIIAGLVGSTVLGGPGALIPAAVGLETGAISQEMQMKRGEVDENAALVGGLVAGAMEAAPIMLWMRRTGFGEGAAAWVAGRAMSMLAQIPEEAGTEYAQTIVEALAVEWLAENKDQVSERDLASALEVIKETQGEAFAGAVTGGIAGGGFGALGGTQMSEAQMKRRRERDFKRIMRMKRRLEEIAEEGKATAETIRERADLGPIIREALRTGGELPPLGAPPEVVGGPTVPPFEPTEPTEPTEEPAEPTEPPPEPEEEVAPSQGLPEGAWRLDDTEQGFLIEGQQSTIYELRKGEEQVGTVQLRLNQAGDVVIVDHVETEAYGYARGAVSMFELRAEAAKLFPEATHIAGRRGEGEDAKWVSIRLHPKKKAELPPTTEPEVEPEPEEAAAPTMPTTEIPDEVMAKVIEDIEHDMEEGEVDTEHLKKKREMATASREAILAGKFEEEGLFQVYPITLKSGDVVAAVFDPTGFGGGSMHLRGPMTESGYRSIAFNMEGSTLEGRKTYARLEAEHAYQELQLKDKIQNPDTRSIRASGEMVNLAESIEELDEIVAHFAFTLKRKREQKLIADKRAELEGPVEPEAPPEPEVPTEPEPFEIGQVLYRKRDGMSAEVINVKRSTAGHWLVRLKFKDGHSHTFRTIEINNKFSEVPGAEAAPEPEVEPEAPTTPTKKGAAKEEVREAVADVVTSSGLDHTYGTIFDRVKGRLGKAATDAQVTKAIDELVAEGVIEESTTAYKGQEEPIYRRPAQPELPERESKSADNVIEATPEEEAAVAGARGEPQGDGFTRAQRKWIVDSLDGVKDIPEPQEPGPTHYAVEMRVPDDGTFYFASGEAADEFRKLVRKPRTVGVSPIKRPGVLRPAPLPYSTKGGWGEGVQVEGGEAVTDGHMLILKLDDKPPAKVTNRIKKTKMAPDEKKLQASSVERVVKSAKEGPLTTIRVRSLVWPNRDPHGISGEYEVILETEDGTRVTDRTISWDKMRFLMEATGADEMRTNLTVGTYNAVGFYKDGELVGVVMPARDKNYHTTEPNPAVEEAEGETPAAEGTKANTDRFRGFHQDNGAQGSGGGSLAAPAPPQLKVLGVGFPELVKLAKKLGKGKFPRVKRVLLRNPGVLGFFRFKGPGSPFIALRAAIFAEPEQAASTLAHEIGHWVDFVPDRTFARGNLLGRLMSVVRYLKHTASMIPGGQGEITPEDRKRIKDEAKAASREEYWEEIEEVIRTELGITVDDVLNIWRMYEPDAPKDLIDYIKGLDRAQKVAIVKAAMAGLVHETLNRFKRVVEEKTGKKRRVKKVRYHDAEKKYRELLHEEMRKRQLVSIEEIRDEMWELSITWRPLPANPSRKHLAYRKQGDEIYADAVSAFLNDPELMQRIAPKSFQMFMNYLSRKQQFYDDWQMLQQVADDPDALNRARADDYEEMIARGERSRAKDLKERLGIGLGYKRYRATIGEALASGFVDRNEAWYRLRRLRRKKPEDETWHEENDPINFIEELAYANAAYAYYLDRWQAEVMKPLEEMGINANDLGVILGLRRAGRARARGGRKELANPLGIGDRYARDVLAQFLKDKGYTTADKRLIVEALQRWQAIREEVLGEIEEAGMFKTSLTDLMRNSLGAYATFKVRQYIESPDPHVGAALGNVHRQIGTLSEIGNPVIETILKDLALARAAHRTRTIKTMIDQLVDADPDAVMPAFQKKVRGIKLSFPPAPEGMRLVVYMQNGSVRGVYMNHEYAKALDRRETGTAYTFYRLATTPVRAVMVTHNPFWAIFNTERDYRAMLKQVVRGNPVSAFLTAMHWTLTSAPETFRDVARNSRTLRRYGQIYEKLTGKKYDGSARIVRAMMKDRALIQTGMRFYTAADISEDEAAAMLFQTYGLTEAGHQTVVRKVFGTLASILSGPGQFSERLIKIAGYRYLKAHQEEFGMTDQDVAHMTRSRVGTPDIMRRGDWHNFTNSIFLFSNVAKEGYRAAWESVQENPVEYTAKTITYDVLPTVVKWMAASGFLGAAIKGLFDRIPEYQKRTYTVIPIGMTSSGKAVYITLPHDHIGQLLISSMWGILSRNESVRQELSWEAAQNLPWSHGNLHPFVESAIQWGQYASGINPSDWYRGRGVIPEKVWEAQDIGQMRRYMLGNQLDNLGLRVLTDLTRLEDENGDVTPEKVADWIEKGSGWPVAGSFLRRFIRVSDRGISEEGFRRFREADEGPNQARIDRDAVLKEVLQLNDQADGWDALMELERRGVDPAYKYDKEKELARKLDTRMDTLRLRYHGTEYDRLRSYANNEDRKAIVDELEREVEGEE
jgi:hypothetical protein